MNYYELNPEDNTFSDVIINTTNRCNMTCKNCYITNRSAPDMDIDQMLQAIDKFPKKTNVRIIGAEPTMRKDLPEIIQGIKAAGHRHILLTNGLRMANADYTRKLKAAGLNHVYLSLNGVDNDDWYEEIDELRCAKKKLQALDNIIENKMILQTGTIVAKGINEGAIGGMVNLLAKRGAKHAIIRIKNVGQIGRYMNEADGNLKMDTLKQMCVEQLGVSMDYLNYWQQKPIIDTLDEEPNTFMFPLDPASEHKNLHRGGYWIKIANWDTDNSAGIPSPDNLRRGVLTQNFKVAPFFEDIIHNSEYYNG
jgi:molybdenum cofactor biosynthesis enzyme MoaA